MPDKKQRLRDIIAAKSLLRGNFTLASGKASGYFFDMKKTMFAAAFGALALAAPAFADTSTPLYPETIPGAGLNGVAGASLIFTKLWRRDVVSSHHAASLERDRSRKRRR